MDNESDGDLKKNLASIIDDFDKRQSDQRSKDEKASRKTRGQNAARKVFSVIGVCVIVILAVNSGISFLGKKPFISKHYPWIVGLKASQGYRLEDCLFRMWQVRKAIDLYYAQHNDFSSAADALYREGFLAQKIVCPATGSRYSIKQGANGDIFCCPNPSEHGVKDIWADVAGGAPVVERE